MKRIVFCAALLVLWMTACQKESGTPRIQKNSQEYLFFKTLSETAPLLDPDRDQTIVTCSAFNVSTADLLPRIYSIAKRQSEQWNDMSKETLHNYIHQLAVQDGEKRLLLVQAKAEGMKAPKDTVEKALQKYYAQAGGKDAFIKSVSASGLSLKAVRSEIETRWSIERFTNEILFKGLAITEPELKSAYERETMATVRQIALRLVGKNPAEKETVEKRMKELLARAKRGENFARLASAYTEETAFKSRGGLNESIARAAMMPAFEKAIFSLPIGGISEILEAHGWLYIVKVVDRWRETKPFIQVEDQLRQELLQAKKRDRFIAVMDSLKAAYSWKDLYKPL